MAEDKFEFHQPDLSDPTEVHFVITPSDSENIPQIPRAVYVVNQGDVVAVDKKGEEVTYPAHEGWLPLFRPVQIKATGTTSTLIVGYR